MAECWPKDTPERVTLTAALEGELQRPNGLKIWAESKLRESVRVAIGPRTAEMATLLRGNRRRAAELERDRTVVSEAQNVEGFPEVEKKYQGWELKAFYLIQ